MKFKLWISKSQDVIYVEKELFKYFVRVLKLYEDEYTD